MQLPENIWNNEKLVEILDRGGVVVMPTDTLYGIVGSALNEKTVDRIYQIRGRDTNKPCIILIGDMGELEKFSIQLSKEQEPIIKNFTVPTSFILDCPDGSLSYLHRSTGTLAFRIPQTAYLRALLSKTGPLIAPSANPQREEPARAIEQAKKYFGESVDLYVDGGTLSGRASKVIRLNENGSSTTIRE